MHLIESGVVGWPVPIRCHSAANASHWLPPSNHQSTSLAYIRLHEHQTWHILTRKLTTNRL